MNKLCQKLSCFARSAKLTLKSAVVCKKNSEKTNGDITWSAVLTTVQKVARQNSGKILIWVGKIFIQLQFFYHIFSINGFAGLVGSDFANPAYKYLPMSGKYSKQIRSNLKHFLTNENLWKLPLDWLKSVSSILPLFLPKGRKMFADSRDLFLSIYNLKQIVFLQSFLSTCRSSFDSSDNIFLPKKNKNLSLKIGRWTWKVFKIRLSFRQIIPFLLRKCFQKGSSGNVEWSAVLTILPKIADQKSGKFRSKWEKT